MLVLAIAMLKFVVHTLFDRGMRTYVACSFSLRLSTPCIRFKNEVYIHVYSVLVLAVATPKYVVHMLLERGIHTHI